jgi:hypothetical protein
VKRFLIFAATAVLLQGCSTNLGFQFGNAGKSATAPSVGPGNSFSSGGVKARFTSGDGSLPALGN